MTKYLTLHQCANTLLETAATLNHAHTIRDSEPARALTMTAKAMANLDEVSRSIIYSEMILETHALHGVPVETSAVPPIPEARHE